MYKLAHLPIVHSYITPYFAPIYFFTQQKSLKTLILLRFQTLTLMPATGIEPVLYRYNRILSPARLPVPPRGRIHYIQGLRGSLLSAMGGEGFEPSKALPADLQSVPFGHSGIHPYETILLSQPLEILAYHVLNCKKFFFYII